MTVLNVTRVVNGKKVVPKQSNHPQIPKAYFVRQLNSQLNAALTRDARLLEKLHARKAIDAKLQGLIESFTKHVISVVDSFPIKGERIPAIFFNKVQLLKPIQEQFIKDCQQIISKSDIHSRRITFITEWLADDVTHFATQVEMTYSSIPAFFDGATNELLPPSIENIPNRLRNPEKERIFLEAIHKYQSENGRKKFMPYKFILPLMEAAGLEFSVRSFSLFKEDYSLGKLGKLVR
jgi:hypothetical protein